MSEEEPIICDYCKGDGEYMSEYNLAFGSSPEQDCWECGGSGFSAIPLSWRRFYVHETTPAG